MNAEVFKIMIIAAIPLLIVGIFIGVDYFGVSRRFDAILTAMTYATIGFFAVWRAYGGMWVYLRDLRMITIVLDGRYLVIAGAILNLIGMFAVFMTDSGYTEDNIDHYILYLLIVAATMLVIVGISIMW